MCVCVCVCVFLACHRTSSLITLIFPEQFPLVQDNRTVLNVKP